MRIVIDMQGAQASNSNRGIGRYTMSLAQAIVQNRGKHEVILALSGMFPETVQPIRSTFAKLLPQENIQVWHSLGPVASDNSDNRWRRNAAECAREAFLTSLEPDIILVSSLFEGLGDDAVTSVHLFSENLLTAVILYDLIPYIYRSPYLDNPCVETWYLEKIEHLRRADLWLAISDSSRREGVKQLNLPESRSVDISTDADPQFQSISVSADVEQKLRQKYRLHRPFVMYTGGVDHRKNLEGLITAYSKLSVELRAKYQLAIVCSVQDENKRLLEQLASEQGLDRDEMILTGFVPEEDLVALYNLCELFVFPSKHEGFGLPVLEAMRCGAPVIGANTSSLPEVIGWEEALFSPNSVEEITVAIKRSLTDLAFRHSLIEHGKKQAGKFNWKKTAIRAIEAMEELLSQKQAESFTESEERLPKLAYVSPLPPERTGIADYSAELIPALAQFYDIDVICAQDSLSFPWLEENASVRSVEWFAEHSHYYDRVLYHFGNSSFHQHMFSLLEKVPGVIVLHDFFLSGIVAHMDVARVMPGEWDNELYRSHGYHALYERYQTENMADVVWKYPCSLSVIQAGLGVIVHSENSLRLASQWYGADIDDWKVIPLLRGSEILTEKVSARQDLGFSDDDFLVCAFGILGPAKLNHRLIDAWIKSTLQKETTCSLVFVGENEPGDYGKLLLKKLSDNGLKARIHITGWVTSAEYKKYLAAADIGIQLRSMSRGETSAAVLDCMNFGLPTIINSNGSMADLPDDVVWKLPDLFTDEQLIEALETLWQSSERRRVMGEAARQSILDQHNPQSCARQYQNAIEDLYQKAKLGLPGIYRTIAEIAEQPLDKDLIRLAHVLNANHPPRNRQRQLMVDISELVQRDAKTGIQRVVRSILQEWLLNPPDGYRVEPVYATEEEGYRYARLFTTQFLDIDSTVLIDEPIDYAFGDIFFALDLQPHVQVAQRNFYQIMRNKGVQTVFMVYDLLCALLPDSFPEGAKETFVNWLLVVAENDGAVCISKSVADELYLWIENHQINRVSNFQIDWFHLGADVENSHPSMGVPKNANSILNKLKACPSFLMVGTLEPRKAHTQVLDAFEQLWSKNLNVNLVIVGKQGWLVDTLVERLSTHPHLNRQLFWLDSISDEYLDKVYAASSCLVAASEGEGFGLPLIEAAQHKLPIMARNIPVFHEVAGTHAFYFDAEEPEDLAASIEKWMKLYNKSLHPSSKDMPWLTWEQSAQDLLNTLLGNRVHSQNHIKGIRN